MRNDGRMAAYAESCMGVGKGIKVFSMLTLGTGIGGSLIIEGKLFDGYSNDAGDFGHHVICDGELAFECACGKHGCFETQASAQGLVRHYDFVLKKSYHQLVHEKKNNNEKRTRHNKFVQIEG
jgi:glucokinase